MLQSLLQRAREVRDGLCSVKAVIDLAGISAAVYSICKALL
jgi:hypothetical protein